MKTKTRLNKWDMNKIKGRHINKKIKGNSCYPLLWIDLIVWSEYADATVLL